MINRLKTYNKRLISLENAKDFCVFRTLIFILMHFPPDLIMYVAVSTW
jgi:hypothetical protein